MPDGDDDFAEFANVETRRLFALACAMTGNQHDAWDLVQETLVRIRLRWDRLRRENPGGYATTVITRLNVDRVRRLRREFPWHARAHEESYVEPVRDMGLPPWLGPALSSLTPRQRTALALRYIEELDIAAIADRMGCSQGTARSHLSRGLDRMRAHLTANQQQATQGADER